MELRVWLNSPRGNHRPGLWGVCLSRTGKAVPTWGFAADNADAAKRRAVTWAQSKVRETLATASASFLAAEERDAVALDYLEEGTP